MQSLPWHHRGLQGHRTLKQREGRLREEETLTYVELTDQIHARLQARAHRV